VLGAIDRPGIRPPVIEESHDLRDVERRGQIRKPLPMRCRRRKCDGVASALRIATGIRRRSGSCTDARARPRRPCPADGDRGRSNRRCSEAREPDPVAPVGALQQFHTRPPLQHRSISRTFEQLSSMYNTSPLVADRSCLRSCVAIGRLHRPGRSVLASWIQNVVPRRLRSPRRACRPSPRRDGRDNARPRPVPSMVVCSAPRRSKAEQQLDFAGGMPAPVIRSRDPPRASHPPRDRRW